MRDEYLFPTETYSIMLPTDAKSEDITVEFPHPTHSVCKGTASTTVGKSHHRKKHLKKRGWRWITELIRSLIPDN